MNKIVIFLFALVIGVHSGKETCQQCVPQDKCEMFGEMSKREQDRWVEENPCQMLEDDDTGPLFGFAPMAKGDLICCPFSNIWGVENPTTSHNDLSNKFGQGSGRHGNYKQDDDRQDRVNSKEFHSDDGYNQDNLHKKQNSNIHRDDVEDDEGDDFDYEKQRNPNWWQNHNRPASNFGRGPSRNFNGPRNQPITQGGGNNRLPVFGPNGMPVTSRPTMNRPNNFNPIPESPGANNGGQCLSILPPDSESGCCGMDLAAERMAVQPNYMNRPARVNNPPNTNNRPFNNNRPVNPNYGRPNSNFRPYGSDFRPTNSFGPGSNSWSNPSMPHYPRRRFTRETPEEVGISLDNRIAGGKRTELYQFPWTALLKTTFDYGDRKSTFNCGGSLISSRYVLTAAHCVTEPGSRISSIDIYLAEYDKRTFPRDCINTPEGQKCIDNILVHAEAVFPHPDYDDEKLQSDIALIKLTQNIPYTEYTRPICLPPINIDNPEYSNLRLAVAGWGRNGSVPSDVKQSTVVNLVPQYQCASSYPRLTKQHVCAAGRTGEDTCKGDSGGPLMMLYEGKYYVSGVVSGKRADAPCGTSVPSLYTNVYQFLPWIKQNIRN